jgi:4-hydroxybenzoate polyprenyltransferase
MLVTIARASCSRPYSLLLGARPLHTARPLLPLRLIRPLSTSRPRFSIPTPTLPAAPATPTVPSALTEELLDPAAPPPPLVAAPTVLDKVLPKWAERAKPYLLLTRIDKPIGSILLFWPCGESSHSARGVEVILSTHVY